MNRRFDLAAYYSGTPDTFEFNAESRLTSELLAYVVSPDILQKAVVEDDDVDMPREVFHQRCRIVLDAALEEINKRVPVRII
jgi:hypothetical protein